MSPFNLYILLLLWSHRGGLLLRYRVHDYLFVYISLLNAVLNIGAPSRIIVFILQRNIFRQNITVLNTEFQYIVISIHITK